MTHAWTKVPADERYAATVAMTDPASPHYVPFYARPENVRVYGAMKKVADWIGFHAVCDRPECRRAGRCGAEDRRDLPPCLKRHREIARLIFEVWNAHRVSEAGRGAATPPGTGVTVLEAFQASGVDIDKLRRPKDPTARPWCWEYADVEPPEEYRAMVAMLMAEWAALKGAGSSPAKAGEGDRAERGGGGASG